MTAGFTAYGRISSRRSSADRPAAVARWSIALGDALGIDRERHLQVGRKLGDEAGMGGRRLAQQRLDMISVGDRHPLISP
jgi:hypothetical protein